MHLCSPRGRTRAHDRDVVYNRANVGIAESHVTLTSSREVFAIRNSANYSSGIVRHVKRSATPFLWRGLFSYISSKRGGVSAFRNFVNVDSRGTCDLKFNGIVCHRARKKRSQCGEYIVIRNVSKLIDHLPSTCANFI